MKCHTVHDLGAFVDLGFRLRLMSPHKSKFKSGTVEKNSSTKNIGLPAWIESTSLRCRCNALNTKQMKKDTQKRRGPYFLFMHVRHLKAVLGYPALFSFRKTPVTYQDPDDNSSDPSKEDHQ